MELVVLLAVTFGVIGIAGRLPDPQRIKRDLARTPVVPLESLPTDKDGKLVAIRGVVEQIDPRSHVVAPVSQESCVYFQILFDEVGIGGDFHELGRADGGCPFLLASAKGSARIVPEHVGLAVPGTVYTRSMFELEDSRINDTVIRIARGVCKRPNHPMHTSLRIREYVVKRGMDVRVRGWCTFEPVPEAHKSEVGYRADVPTRPVISGTKRKRLLIG